MTPAESPPARADRLLEWALPPGDRGLSIIGDLHLEFADIVSRRGQASARLWYWRETFALIARYAWTGWARAHHQLGREVMATLWADARFAIRMLFKTPGLSLIAILTIALGVGLTTMTYSSLDGTVLRGLPVPDADRLMFVSQRIVRLGIQQTSVPFQDFLDLRERQSAFDDLAAVSWAWFNIRNTCIP